jgi:CheY-like chemotaxis protein
MYPIAYSRPSSRSASEAQPDRQQTELDRPPALFALGRRHAVLYGHFAAPVDLLLLDLGLPETDGRETFVAAVMEHIEGIATTLDEIFARSEREQQSPARVADALARERFGRQ